MDKQEIIMSKPYPSKISRIVSLNVKMGALKIVAGSSPFSASKDGPLLTATFES